MAEVGYRSSDIGAPVGSISRQPNPAHRMLLLAFEDGIGIRATFLGDVTEDLADWSLFVDDAAFPVDTISFNAGTNRTSVVFEASATPFVDGQDYALEFKEYVVPAPFNISPPSIEGPVYAGQTIAEAFPDGPTPGSWENADSIVPGWLVNGEEEADTYELQDGDDLQPFEAASNASPLSPIYAYGDPVTVEIAPVEALTIDGLARMESVLSMVGDSDATARKWQSAPWNDGDPDTWSDVSGATSDTFALTADEKFEAIRAAKQVGGEWHYSPPIGPVVPFYSFTGGVNNEPVDGNIAGARVKGTSGTEKNKIVTKTGPVWGVTGAIQAPNFAMQFEDVGSGDMWASYLMTHDTNFPSPTFRASGTDLGSDFEYLRCDPTGGGFALRAYRNGAAIGTGQNVSGPTTDYRTHTGYRLRMGVVGEKFFAQLQTEPGSNIYEDLFPGGVTMTATHDLTGTECGITGGQFSGAAVCDDLQFESAGGGLNIYSAVVERDYANNQNDLRIKGSCSEGTTGLEMRLKRRSDGHLFTDWMATTVLAIGAGTFDVLAENGVPAEAMGVECAPEVRKTDSTFTAGTIMTPPVYQSVAPMKLGMQHGYFASYTDHDLFNDRSRKAVIGIRQNNVDRALSPFGSGGASSGWVSEDGVGQTIKVVGDTIFPVTGYANPQGIYYEPHIYWTASGEATIFLPTGLNAVTVNGGSGFDLVRAYDSADGKIIFNVTQGRAASNSVKFRIAWADIPVEGLPLCPPIGLVRTGETEMDPIDEMTPEAQAQISSTSMVYRGMTSQGSNYVFQNPGSSFNPNEPYGGRTTTVVPSRSSRWQGPAAFTGGMTAEDMLLIHFSTGAQLWDNGISFYDTDAVIEEHMTVYAESAMTERLIVQSDNELWNSAFHVHYHDIRLRALRMGFGRDITNSGEATPDTVYDSRLYGYNRYTGIFANDVPADLPLLVDVNSLGLAVFKSKVNITGGNEDQRVPASHRDNDYWELIYTNTQTSNASWRFQAWWINHIKSLIDPIFIANGKPTPLYVLGSASNITNNQGEFNNNTAVALAFDDAYESIDAVAYNSYAANWGSYRVVSNGVPQFNPNFPRSDRDYIFHDLEEANDRYAAAILPTHYNVLTKLENDKQRIARFLFDKGADPEKIRAFIYEGINDHWTSGFNWPDEADVYSPTTTYGIYQFAYSTVDGQTYMSKVNENLGNEPTTSPTQWEVYQDAVQAAAGLGERWDAAFSTERRYPSGHSGPYYRNFDRWQRAYQKSAQQAAVLEAALNRGKERLGDVQVRFQLNQEIEGAPSTSVLTKVQGDFASWGFMRRETDTEDNPVYDMFAAYKTALET